MTQTAESRSTLHLQEQLAQIRAECKRLEVMSAVRADASIHAQKLDEEALELHGELERVNAQIGRLDPGRSPNARAAPRDPSETLRNVVMLRKRKAALERVLEKCTDPMARMREDTELKRLLAEVHKVQKETELRAIELRQLDRTADTVGRARIEAEKRRKESQQADGDLDARQMDQLSEASHYHQEKCQAALDRVQAAEREYNGWLQVLWHATQMLRARKDAPASLRALCDEPSPALSLLEVLARLGSQWREASSAAEQALTMERHTLAKLERLHHKLVHADDEALLLGRAASSPVSPGAAADSPTRASRARRSLSEARATAAEQDTIAQQGPAGQRGVDGRPAGDSNTAGSVGWASGSQPILTPTRRPPPVPTLPAARGEPEEATSRPSAGRRKVQVQGGGRSRS